MVNRPEVVVDARPALERLAAMEFLARAHEAIAARGTFIVALPGGSAATAFFPAIARLALDWSRVEFFWIDERAVPPDHPDSNYGLAAKLLLRPAGILPSHVHRMRGEQEDLEASARRASDELIAVAGDPARLDLALVGVGEDGHVASLFSEVSVADDAGPQSLAVGAEQPRAGAAGPQPLGGGTALQPLAGSAGLQPCPIVAVYNAPKPPPRRLTMTMPVLASAARIVVGAFGPEKARVIDQALRRAEDRTPLAGLLRRARSSMVLVDGPYSH